jgi:hypothetical protein
MMGTRDLRISLVIDTSEVECGFRGFSDTCSD